jgi:hypothetical protein
MDRVQKPINSECHAPSPEPFRFFSIIHSREFVTHCLSAQNLNLNRRFVCSAGRWSGQHVMINISWILLTRQFARHKVVGTSPSKAIGALMCWFVPQCHSELCVGVHGIWLTLCHFGLQVDTVVWCCYVTTEGLFSTICTDDNCKRWRGMNGRGRRRLCASFCLLFLRRVWLSTELHWLTSWIRILLRFASP